MRKLLASVASLALVFGASGAGADVPPSVNYTLGNVSSSGAVTTGDCAKFLTSTVIQDAGAACGGSGGSPGGSNGQLQYNNSGAFGGAAGLTTDGTNLTGTGNITGNVFLTASGTKTAPGLKFYNGTGGIYSRPGVVFAWSDGTNEVAYFGFGGLLLKSTYQISWSSSAPDTAGGDTFIARRAAASLNLGASDAASPVAQTLGVQDVVAGTSNTAGALWTLSDSAGTGTAASGGVVIQTHPADTAHAITAVSGTASPYTITATGSPAYTVGTVVTVTGMSPSSLNGSYTVTSASAGSFTATTAATGTYVSGGSAIISATSQNAPVNAVNVNANGVYFNGAGNIQSNEADGYQALYKNTTGSNNSAQGYQALFSNTTGGNNSAQGVAALYSNTTGSNNSAQGFYALYSNTTGSFNSAQGYQALYNNTTGIYSSAQGFYALYSNTTGTNNSAQGGSALLNNTTGGNNSAQGVNALYSNTTGANNTASGYQACQAVTTGTGNVCVGANTAVDSATGSNQININNIYYQNRIVFGGIRYSAAGTPLPTCNSSTHGMFAVVSDATSPTYRGAYTSGGAVETPVYCDGTSWTTH